MEPIDPRIDPRLVPPGSKAVVVAEHQDEYRNLPSIVTPQRYDATNGRVTRPNETITRWTFTDDERRRIAKGEDLYITIVGVPIRPFFATVGVVDWSK
jgi:hypothetical protein